MPETPEARISLRCECGAKLRVKATMAGKTGRCPKCQRKIAIPSADEAAESDTGPIPIGDSPPMSDQPFGLGGGGMDDDGSLLDALAAQEKSQPAIDQPQSSKSTRPCPHCSQPVPTDSVLCISCGYNLETGKRVKAVSAKRADAVNATRKWAVGAGTFAFGCALSGAGALLGAAAWSGVCIATDYEIGFIAWGLGVLAGMGMIMGYKGENVRAGLAACVIAILGIVGAKGFVFTYSNYSELQSMQREVSLVSDEYVDDRDRLAEHRAQISAWNRGFIEDSEEWDGEYERAYVNILNLSPQQLANEIEILEAWEAGEKWDDPQHVRSFLIYMKTLEQQRKQEDQLGDDREADTEIHPDSWRAMRRIAKTEVDKMTPEEQLEIAKTIEHERIREEKTLRLAGHEMVLAYYSTPPSERDELSPNRFEQLEARFEAMSDEELDAAAAELDVWNSGGKWNDVEWVRNRVIQDRVSEAVNTLYEDTDDEDYEGPTEQQRQKLYDEATRDADQVPHEERVVLVKKFDEDRKRMVQQVMQNSRERFSDELQSDYTGQAFSYFVENYFSVFDILFVGLAVASAFKIAMGGGVNDD